MATIAVRLRGAPKGRPSPRPLTLFPQDKVRSGVMRLLPTLALSGAIIIAAVILKTGHGNRLVDAEEVRARAFVLVDGSSKVVARLAVDVDGPFLHLMLPDNERSLMVDCASVAFLQNGEYRGHLGDLREEVLASSYSLFLASPASIGISGAFEVVADEPIDPRIELRDRSIIGRTACPGLSRRGSTAVILPLSVSE